MNLLENAIKYTRQGTIELLVRAVPSKEGGTLEFEVSDTGSGIPEAELPFIFKPYYQAGLQSKAGAAGHGLGLSIVKKLIGEQNGSIEVSSRQGRGTTFRFRIPFEPVPAEGRPVRAEKPGFPSKGELSGVSVLIFEDNPLNQKLLESRLGQWGCTVFMADKVPAGMRLLQQECIDVILMDLRMPLMDGYQATAEIRARERSTGKHARIIALTAHAMKGDEEKALDAGCEDYVVKPLDEDELIAKIAKFLE